MFLDLASCKSDSNFLMLFSRFSSSGDVVCVCSNVSVARFGGGGAKIGGGASDVIVDDVVVVVFVFVVDVDFDADVDDVAGWSFVERPCMTSWNCSSERK